MQCFSLRLFVFLPLLVVPLFLIFQPFIKLILSYDFVIRGATDPIGPWPPYLSRLHDHRHSSLGRTPLDKWSARRRDLYLTTHNIHKRQTAMPPAGFEPTIPASERLQNHALDRAAAGIGPLLYFDVLTCDSGNILLFKKLWIFLPTSHI
jgi:hypothetical protein